ncbi:MAG: hypothetical protein GY703_08905 [Gammaproteobacteria bacterium]|nr:hypothetical protein [Gammaproteobacteria bacterium]
MVDHPENGTRRNLDGKECVYYDGYWIRNYPVPKDTLAVRKIQIEILTKRAFHHTESGINTPGERLEVARAAYDRESDPARKRVNGAMLAGALFNRATDIFNTIVELESKGVEVSPANELMMQCEACFRQALELGKQVKHYSGEEGIDELWGEPLKAFTQPVGQMFESRYRKIAQTMADIDRITACLIESIRPEPALNDVVRKLHLLASSAKLSIETMKTDDAFFIVWPAFIAAREAVESFEPKFPSDENIGIGQRALEGLRLVGAGAALITYLSEARVPMPKSTDGFIHQCEFYKKGALRSAG